MLSIEINDEFLDLPSSAQLQLEQNSPFLQFADDVVGEYSYPFDVKNSAKNLRLLNFAGSIQKRIDNTGIEAKVYDNGTQHSTGKVKIEKPVLNLNNNNQSTISCYYLLGLADFYQDIKDKMLRSVDVGGNRTFAWDDYALSGSGFWGHITTVLQENKPGYGNSAYDYAFFPVVDKDFTGIKSATEVMNGVEYDSGQVKFKQKTTDDKDGNAVVPFPYLKYVLIKTLQYVGWTIQGDILDDDDFKKITLVNFQAIYWCNQGHLSGLQHPRPLDTVTFNLADNLPDITITEFMQALRKRFAWWYDFDRKNKIVTIRKQKDVLVATTKDFSQYCTSIVTKTILQDLKIYALKNDFASSLGDGAPVFSSVLLQGNVNNVTDLPTASESLYAQVYLVVNENNYYICRQADDTDDWGWELYAYNIYDYDPGDSTDEIHTSATTVGVEYYDSYLDLVPRIDNEPSWMGRSTTDATWNLNLLFYQGLRNNKSATPYPYACSHLYDSNGNKVSDWSLCFQCVDTSGNQVGLYDLEWKPIFDILQSIEQLEITLSLPVHEYLNLAFNNRIVVNGVLTVISIIKATVPYSKQVILETIRI